MNFYFLCDTWKTFPLSRSMADTARHVPFTISPYPTSYRVWEVLAGPIAIQDKGYISQLSSHLYVVRCLSSGQLNMFQMVMWQIPGTFQETLACSYVFYALATTPFLPSCYWEHGYDSWSYIMDHKNEDQTLKMVE